MTRPRTFADPRSWWCCHPGRAYPLALPAYLARAWRRAGLPVWFCTHEQACAMQRRLRARAAEGRAVMGRGNWHGVLNCGDADLLRRFFGWLGRQDGVVEVTVKHRRNTRSLQQLRWYWACICTPLAEHLSEQDYEVTTAEDAHELLKDRFIKRPVCDPETGEVLGHVTGSTGDLDLGEMADYCERCRAWMLDFFGIVTMDPDPDWRETKQAKQKQLTAANAAETRG